MDNFIATDFIESLRRLYQEKKLLKAEQISRLFLDKRITEEELDYVLGEEK